MKTTNSKSKTSGKKREDRAVQAKAVFDPVSVDCKTAHTIVLMLKSLEECVVLQALSALDRFAVKSPENQLLLLELGILDSLLPLIIHSDLYVRRFTNKLLGEMCALVETKNILLEDKSYIEHFVDILIKEPDVVIHEFSSLILSELTSLPAGCAMVLQTNILDILFTRITSPDPDVQKNCAQILANILNDPVAGDLFVVCPAFHFGPILKLLHSEFPMIQNLGIRIIDYLTQRRQDEGTQEAFRLSQGVEEALLVLETFTWKDLHHNMLGVLSNIVDCPLMANYMNSSGCLRRLLQYIDNIHDHHLKEDTLDVIVKMATVDIGRKALTDNHVVEEMMRYLHDENSGVITAACKLMGLMSQDQHAVELMIIENPIRDITGLVKKESRSWELRLAAAHATCQILQADKRFCNGLLDCRRQENMLYMLHQPPGKVPVEMLITLINAFTILAAHEDTRTRVMELNPVNTIVTHLQASDTQLQVATCYCLAAYACETAVRESFYLAGGVSKLIQCLKSNSTVLQQAAASLVQILSSDATISTAIIHSGALHWMLEQKSIRSVCPSWETAIESLLKSCLPVKFAIMGHLDMQDVTGESFYVTKHSKRSFLVLEELLTARATPLWPIYVVNFQPSEPVGLSSSTSRLIDQFRTNNSSNKRLSPHKTLSIPMKNKQEMDVVLMTRYGACPPDPYLSKYLEDVKKNMNVLQHQNSESKVPSIQGQAKILAEFVAKQMCGHNYKSGFNKQCSNHRLEMQLSEIKLELGTNLIPLGYLREGNYFERALLFKVLADRLSLPCSLVRGEYGRTWIEVAIPQSDHPGEIHAIPLSAIPNHLLRPNHVVDLIESPGTLLPVGSYMADKYCGILF